MRKLFNTGLFALICLAMTFGQTVEVKAEQISKKTSKQITYLRVKDIKKSVIEEKKVVEVEKEEEEEEDEITIFEVTDIHYISNNINDKGEAFQKTMSRSDGRETYYIEELTDALVYEIQQKQPDILIVSGDLTHNGEKESHIEIAKKLSKIEESGTTVLVTPGNHDINNPYAREFKNNEIVVTYSITPEEFEEIYYEFGFSDAAARDKDSLSYLSKVSNDLWILMLDTNKYEQNEKYPITGGVLNENTLNWISECGELAESSDVEILGVMHHNLYNHSELLYEGFTIDNSEEVLGTLKDSGINLVLSGHIHVQDIASDNEKTVFDIATSGFVVYPVNYGELVYSKTNGFTYGTKNVDVEGWAASTNNTDENLLNFSEYSKEHFYDEAYKSAYRRIVDYEMLLEDDDEVAKTKAMAETVAILNSHYFGGTLSEIDKELGTDIENTVGYKLWVENSYDYFAKYVFSMVEAKDRQTTELELSSEDLKK